MEPRQLRYFAAVAAHGDFNRAVRELHLTQPAACRHSQNQEEEFGAALLQRTHNAVSLRSADEQFYGAVGNLLIVAIRQVVRGEELPILG